MQRETKFTMLTSFDFFTQSRSPLLVLRWILTRSCSLDSRRLTFDDLQLKTTLARVSLSLRRHHHLRMLDPQPGRRRCWRKPLLYLLVVTMRRLVSVKTSEKVRGCRPRGRIRRCPSRTRLGSPRNPTELGILKKVEVSKPLEESVVEGSSDCCCCGCWGLLAFPLEASWLSALSPPFQCLSE